MISKKSDSLSPLGRNVKVIPLGSLLVLRTDLRSSTLVTQNQMNFLNTSLQKQIQEVRRFLSSKSIQFTELKTGINLDQQSYDSQLEFDDMRSAEKAFDLLNRR